jgi:hypothetical protein
MTEKYAWALVSGVGIFFLGGGVSLYHGISGLLAGGIEVVDIQPAIWALSGCLLFETSSYFSYSYHLFCISTDLPAG